jgi:hypothetical protein
MGTNSRGTALRSVIFRGNATSSPIDPLAEFYFQQNYELNLPLRNSDCGFGSCCRHSFQLWLWRRLGRIVWLRLWLQHLSFGLSTAKFEEKK